MAQLLASGRLFGQGRFSTMTNASKNYYGVVRNEAGRLVVESEGEYQVFVTNSLGRIIANFAGKEHSAFNLGTKSLGHGVYFVNFRGKTGRVTGRFIVN
jgi:hypothetical protein